ncbi:putative ribonuclease H-like domain-containing protein [Tanacetum coccineum]
MYLRDWLAMTQPTQTNQTGQQYPNNVQSQQFQQFQTASISANNAKFPYLEKDKYEIWAMKMEYWIQNADHNLWRIVQQGNSPKRLGKDAKGNTIVHPPVSLDEHVAVQRENKVRTLLLQALPEDHMPDFHHYDDARDIWMAVKARFGGNEESKKMRKTMLKQQFTEFSVTEEEGLHKGYDRFQKILSQLNQVQARPDNDDINLKFLRALPSSWSQVALALKTRGGLESMSFDDLYNKLRSLELDVRIGHSYGVKAAAAPTHSAFIGAASSGSKLNYSNQQSIVPSVSQTSGRSDSIMECVLHSFVAENEPDQDMIYEDFDQVDQLEMEELDLKWQMAMLSLRINRFEKKAGRKMNYNNQQPARFDRRKVRCYKCLQLGHFARECNVKIVDDKARYSAFKVTEVKTDEPKALVSVDSMVNWSDHAAENKTGEVEKVYGMMAGLHADNGGADVSDATAEFAMMGISPKAQKEKKEWEVKFEATLARFEKWKESSKNLKKLINSSMSTRTKIGLGFKEYVDKPKLFVLSTTSVFYPDPVEEIKLLYLWFVKAGVMHDVSLPSLDLICPPLQPQDQTKDFPPTVDIKTLPESGVEDPNSTAGSPSFSCLENVKNLLGSFVYKSDSVPCKSKAASVPAGSRNSPASVTAGGSDPAASRNRPAVNSADRPNPAGWSKRPATVSAGRPVSAGWLNPAARPYFRPSSVYFNNMYWPDLYDPMYMNKGRWSTAVKTLRRVILVQNNNIGIVDRGCSRCMKENKEKRDDFGADQGRALSNLESGDGGTQNSREHESLPLSHLRPAKPEHKVTCLVWGGQKHPLIEPPDGTEGWLCELQNNSTKFTWTFYLGTKDETFYVLKEFIALIENQLNKKVKGIRCDNGTEFKNAKLIELCGEKGIKRDYSNPRTPQQNGVAERKNRTLIEAARTMLADSKLPTMFWTEAVSTACYVLNRVSITNPHNKTPYQLLSGKVPQIGHLKPFGCQVTILNTSDHLGKFEGKADEGYLVGYAPNSKAYRVYNLTNKRVEETMNLRFLEDKPNVQGIGHEWYFDLDYLTDSLGTQDTDSDSEVDEQVIVVPSFPSNSFAGPSSSNGPSVMERNADYAEELAKLQRQEYEAKDAAARYGYLFSQETAEILSQAEAEIRNQGVSADRDPAGIASAGSDPAGGNPAGSSQPAGSDEPAGKGNPAVSTSVSADFIPVHADESTLPPGQPLGSSENTTRFPVPSDVCMDQLSSGIFTSSSYDDDFSATLTNLAPVVDVNPVPTRRVNTIHPQSQILGDLASPVLTRSRAHKSKFGESAFIGYIQDQQRTNHTDQLHCLSACFLSQLEPTSIAKALEDPDWVDAMQEEMQQFINQQVWKLVPLPDGKHAIGTKWILKNKRDARGIVVRNKARLVAQGHRQEEGIDYDEVFAPVARIEAIRLFLAFASYMGFLVYQLDVKSAFLYGEIEEEVYVTQPKGFEDPYFPKHVYRVVKALYGLHQAPRAWYARLSAFLLQHNYRRGTIDKTLFIKKDSRDILLVQVYVDDIIFGSTNKAWCDEFEVLMKGEFEMSAMGEMTFFLGLQVKQLPDGIFISQDKYVKDMLTKFDMESVRTATTPYEAAKTKLKDETDPPVNVHLYRSMIGSLMYLTASRPDIMFAVSACSRHQVTPLTSHLNAVKKIFKYLKGQPKLGLWYPKDSPFQLEAYSDSDYAGSHGDRKSTTGGCQFLGRRLISWQCKKQTIVATSSTEAEYVAAASCCAQVLWIQNQLLDYGFNFMNTKIFIDNQSTICIVKNPVFHQRTKHIEIRHHFIRDANEKNLIQVLKIHTNDNVADLLTKAFDGPRFEYLVVHIGMVVYTAARCTFFLLDDWFLLLSFLLDALFLLVAMDYAADSVYLLVGILLLVDSFLLIGFVYAANTSIHAADLFLLVVTCFCCVQLDIAGWLVSATSHLVSAGSLHSCWCINVSAA